MLVEDVRPNRFKKAIMMARHFVKRAAGHQISIVVFSDTHKRVVPFTDDIDLLDSVLGGLKDLNLAKGGSELSIAIKESINYFKLNSDYKGGNLLVFTDGEEHNSLESMEIEKEVNLAIVGVGTLKGGPIPIRRSDGSFRGYKKHNRTQVVSSLNENNIKDFVNRTSNSKYWVSLSYSLPTEEILSFFRGRFKSKMASGEVRIRPVLASRVIIPAVILLFLSYLFSLKKTYVSLALLMCLFSNSPSLKAQEVDEVEKPKSALEIQTEDLMEKMKRGSLDERQKLKLAENFLRLKDPKKSELLFEEVVNNPKDYDTDTLLNMSTTYLQNKKFSKAVEIIDEIKSRNDLTEMQNKILENNTLKALRVSNKKKKGDKNEEDKDKKDKDKKDDKKDSKSDDKNDSEKSKDKKKQKSSDSEDKKKEKKSKKKDNNKDSDQKKKDKNKKKKDKKDSGENKKKKKKQKSVKEKEDEIKKKRKMVKVPATLKQLMNDDRGLRKKYLKTTIGKEKGSKKKDW
jgi:Ca-activated chloride channel family protein